MYGYVIILSIVIDERFRQNPQCDLILDVFVLFSGTELCVVYV